jgi:hypothetical protein
LLAFGASEQVGLRQGIVGPVRQQDLLKVLSLFTSFESFAPEGLIPMDLNSISASFLLQS